MKVTEIEKPKMERLIITGMIISTRFLKIILPIYDRKFFQTEFTQRISGWCIDYFKEFHTSPGKHIQDIFHSEENNLEESEAEMISVFLESISDEYDQTESINVEYLVHQTEEYFESVNLENIADQVSKLNSDGRIGDAKSVLQKYRPISVPVSNAFNPYTDLKLLKDAFEHHNEPLMEFPGAFGKMMNSQLTRDALVGILAPEKRGKTWWLIEFAHRGCKAGHNVVFFQMGDLSKRQQIIRFHIRLAGKSNKQQHCGIILKPVMDCKFNQDDTCRKKQRSDGIFIEWKDMKGKKKKEDFLAFFENNREHEPCEYCQEKSGFKGAIWYEKKKTTTPLTWKEGYLFGKRWDRKMLGKNIMLSCHSAGSISVSGIEACLDQWENQDDFIPEIIIIDYADILAPEDSRKEIRHQQNQTWEKLRALSLEKNCLVITATQASAGSYSEKSLKLSHFSESKNKYAHVTCMIGLNQTSEEKRKGIMRVSQMIVREDEFDIDKEVHVLQCLNIGRPFLDSYF